MGKSLELTACCGLYCGDCIRLRPAFAAMARELAQELERISFRQYAQAKWYADSRLAGFHRFENTLKSLEELACLSPCSQGGCGVEGECTIKLCVSEKGLEGCWQCPEAQTCDKFKFLVPFHGTSPQKNLAKINQYGLEEWAGHREPFYTWKPGPDKTRKN